MSELAADQAQPTQVAPAGAEQQPVVETAADTAAQKNEADASNIPQESPVIPAELLQPKAEPIVATEAAPVVQQPPAAQVQPRVAPQPRVLPVAAAASTAVDPKPQPQKPRVGTMLILDTTAKDAARTHEQIVNGSVVPFTFMPGKGLAMPISVAIKFLKHEAFKAVDELGNVIDWKRRPKQPSELGAGEKLKLADDETIARFDELSTPALLQRAVELQGGEQFSPTSDRQEMIDFIVRKTIAQKRERQAQAELADDEFVPEAEIGDHD